MAARLIRRQRAATPAEIETPRFQEVETFVDGHRGNFKNNDSMTSKRFSELGLSAELLKAIDKLGFELASPIQAEAIPILLQGHDVVGQSQTGSGKTAAFAAPAIEKVDPLLRVVQVIILCPTRELAVQVSEELHKLAFFKRGVRALPIYGGQSYERQYDGLRQGAQIVIGTPGRIMDHMRQGTLKLGTVRMAILDEADTMLDMGFREDIEFILQAIPAERQTVFFSATISRAIEELIGKYSRKPQTIRIEQKSVTVPTVEQLYYEVDRRFKLELITRLIDIHDFKLGIIFCNTKRMVDDLVDHLNAQGYSADRLHGDMSQAMRTRVMGKFRQSGLEFLVATDVAARGIDVNDVEVVFNYDLPYDAEDYVHRVGRTGRAGRTGIAISFVAGREIFQIRHIERFTKVRIQRSKVPSIGEVEEARASVVLDKLRTTLQGGEFKRQDQLIERLLEEGFPSTDIASALLHLLQGSDITAQRPPEQPRAKAEPESFRGDRSNRTDERPPSRVPYRTDRQTERQLPSRPPARRPAELPPRPARPPAKASEREGSLPPKERIPIPKPSAAPIPQPLPAAKEEPRSAVKPSRRTPSDYTRLFMNIGSEMSVTPNAIVEAIMGETGLPAKVVGKIDIRDRHLFVDVVAEHANAIISKLNRGRIKNHKLKVKAA